MKRLPIIRETLNYACQFHGSRIVVKVDDKIAVNASERGIFSDIVKIRQAGMEVIVVYSEPELYQIERGLGGVDDNTAVNIAVKQKAQKLIFITNAKGVFYPSDTLISQLSINDTRGLLAKPNAVNGAMRNKLEASIKACDLGIDRVHIIGGEEGDLLLEVFTCDGVGTMIYSKTYEEIRRATANEINDVLEILREAVSKSCFDSVSIAKALDDFWVFSVDGDIHGCMKLTDHSDCKMLEVDCLVVTPRYENSDVMERLLKHALEYAATKMCQGVFINIKENILCLPIYPWFMKLGFKRDVTNRIPLIEKNAGADCWVSVL